MGLNQARPRDHACSSGGRFPHPVSRRSRLPLLFPGGCPCPPRLPTRWAAQASPLVAPRNAPRKVDKPSDRPPEIQRHALNYSGIRDSIRAHFRFWSVSPLLDLFWSADPLPVFFPSSASLFLIDF